MTWIDRLQPASFRAVSFLVDGHDETGGRRLARTSYPGRDKPTVEDLGQAQDGWRIRAYVIADLTSQDYFIARDALRVACRASGPATLIHPYLGRLTVSCESVTLREEATQGGMAVFDLVFWDSGTGPGPTVATDTASGLLSGANRIISLAIQAFAIGSVIAERPGILLGIGEAYIGSLVSSFTGLQPSILFQLGGLLNNLVLSPSAGTSAATSSVTGFAGDPVAIAISDTFATAATLITASAGNPPALTDDPVLGQTSSLARQPADPSQGLAGLATWSVPSVTPSALQAPLQAQLAQQFADLVCGCAVAALTQIYAGTNWISSNAAATARTQLLGFIQQRLLAAAAADDDALFQGWLGLSGLASADLLTRAQSLPSLAPYNTPLSLPSAVLAQRLYSDASQADALVALNDAVHPSFMPTTGVWLVPT